MNEKLLLRSLNALLLLALCAGDWAHARNVDRSDGQSLPEHLRSLHKITADDHVASRSLQQSRTTPSAAEELTWPLDFTDLDRAAETQRILRSVAAER
jgi:hypothetical protein